MNIVLQDLAEWLLKYWIAFTVGILIPLTKWFHGKLKHQDQLTRKVEALEEKVGDLDDKFDKFCEDQKEAREHSDRRDAKLLKTLNSMQLDSLQRHSELKESIAEVSKEAAINKAKLEK